MKITITLPDGSKREFDRGVTPRLIAASIGKRLEKDAVAAVLDGKVVDLSIPLDQNANVAIVTRESAQGLDVLRHSTAHLLAHAVKELYPETQITIGPVTEEGFYYDFSRKDQFTPDDLVKIEARMKDIVARAFDVTRKVWKRDEATEFFKKQGEIYKAEIISSLPEQTVTTYQQGDFTDLCRGPHVPNTKSLGHFKLLSVAGAYWRGDEKNEMLQRIYGTAFATQKELEEHLARLEEAKRRDHRKMGPEMGLFAFLPEAPAMPFYLPKGETLLNTLQSFLRDEMVAKGYQMVSCPQLMTAALWKTSGHWEHYRENMFITGHGEHVQEDNLMVLKPMNCPGHITLFKTKKYSYRDLPLRYAEFTKVHRDERAGVTHGLFRTRTFSIDDGHIFCTEDQIAEEALATIEHTRAVYKMLGFDELEVKLATKPATAPGTGEVWERATNALASSLKTAGLPFEFLEGEGAFYGPKIEFHIKDTLNRRWQCGTIQLDFILPERFQLEYIASDGGARRPVMIHRAIFGSFERMLGILIEHHAGHLPLWLCPTQVAILSLTSDQEQYAKDIATKLFDWHGVRVETDLRGEKLGYKIREAQLRKIPLMVVVGKQEQEKGVLSLRKHTGETLPDLSMQAFKDYLSPQLKPGGITH